LVKAKITYRSSGGIWRILWKPKLGKCKLLSG